MRAWLLPIALVLVACPPAGDDDDSTYPPIIADDDDSTDALDEATPVAVPQAATVCAEAEPNDAPVFPGTTLTDTPPWPDATDCGTVSSSGVFLMLTGRIDHVVQGSWEGDNDAFAFAVAEATSPSITVQWSPLSGDFDARLWCPSGQAWIDASGSGLATSDQPEHIDATATPLPAGASCYLFVTGYSGPVADYAIWLTGS